MTLHIIRSFKAIAALCILILPLKVFSQQLSLIKDINLFSFSDGGDPREFTVMNGFAYFAATSNPDGTELWRTDGTAAGTVMVKNVNALSSSNLHNLTLMNSMLYFGAIGTYGEGLWKSDGTEAGTVLVKSGVLIEEMIVIGSTLYFRGSGGGTGEELWKSDGTEAGTVLVKDIHLTGSSSPIELTELNGEVYFRATDGVHGEELWKSDGTAAGTVMVYEFLAGAASGAPSDLTAIGNTLFFSATGTNLDELWKTDGTVAGTQMLRGFNPVSNAGLNFFTDVNGTLFFEANDGAGRMLWKSDGTVGGTVLVKNISLYSSGSGFGPVSYNGLLYFAGNASPNGVELWKSDGTNAGTVLVKDIYAGGSSLPDRLTVCNGAIYFQAVPGNWSGAELFKSDGTTAGTVMVKDISPGAFSGYPIHFTAYNGNVVFCATDYGSNSELWISDGTTAGTQLVKNIFSEVQSNMAGDCIELNGKVYFRGYEENTSGPELWSSDGTTAGTTRVVDMPGSTNALSPQDFVALGNTMYFSGNSSALGRELWKSDGTAAGTVLVKDIYSNGAGSNPQQLTVSNGRIYFVAETFTYGREIWSSDGTTAGTALLKNITSGNGWSTIDKLTDVNGTLYFSNQFNGSSWRIWKSDGTTAGTVQVNTVPANAVHLGLINFNGTLFFIARISNVCQLWKTDGTAAGTVLVKDLGVSSTYSTAVSMAVKGNSLYFTAEGSDGRELWISDGTTAGTVLLKDVVPGSTSGEVDNITVAGDYVYFTANDGISGNELWRTDGTTGGTTLFADIYPGPVGSVPCYPAVVGNTLYFDANDGVHGHELWRTDGAVCNTLSLGDVHSGYNSSFPKFKAVAGNTILFDAYAPTTGFELYGFADPQLMSVQSCASYTWAANGVTYTTSGIYTHTLQTAVGCDSILTLDLTIGTPPAPVVVQQTACNSYTWPLTGLTYSVSGQYSDTLQTPAGCDSIVTLDLLIQNTTAATVTETACASYTWQVNGATYTNSGQYVATIPNAAGCDSVITLNLTVVPNPTLTVTVDACYDYTWPLNGVFYPYSGQYTHIISNPSGCDTIVTLDLTLHGASMSWVTEITCGSYTWAENGMTYTASGEYMHTIPNMWGCDSTIVLQLTIDPLLQNTVSVTACGSYTWAQTGLTYTTSGEYTDTIANVSGCDSLLILDLIIGGSTSSTIAQTACETYTWPANGNTYTVSGQYVAVIPNAAGCDSVVTLDLTILDATTALQTVSAPSVSYTWPENGVTYTASGQYTYTITNAAGCDSVITLDLDLYELGLETHALLENLHVFPNPANENVSLTFDAPQAVVSVTDVHGKLISEGTVIVSGDQVSLERLETGIYFINVVFDRGKTAVRVVKR